MRKHRGFSVLMCTAMLALHAAAEPTRLRLATTTSTEQSGLLAHVLPEFERRFGVAVDVIAVGSGKALKLGENGDVDVIFAHAPELEEAFVRAGFGVNRRAVMRNDFVLVGPAHDPAGIKQIRSTPAALRRIAERGVTFISRGDESGTHQKERQLWREAEVTPQGVWYVSAGLGMGQVLLMADEKNAYTLSDRGTFLSYRRKGDLIIVQENDPPLDNPYSLIVVNPARYPDVKYIEAMQLIAWLTSPEGQARIGGLRHEGQILFHPMAVPAVAEEKRR